MSSQRRSDDEDAYSNLFGSGVGGGGGGASDSDAGFGRRAGSGRFNVDFSGGAVATAQRGISQVDSESYPATDPNKESGAVAPAKFDAKDAVPTYRTSLSATSAGSTGSGIKPAPAPPPKAGGPGGIGAIGAFAALQGGLMGSVATSAPKSKKQLIEEKIKELEQEHLMKSLPVGLSQARRSSIVVGAEGLDEDLRLTHAAGKFMATDDHGSQLYPHAHHVMGHHRHHRRHRKRTSKQGSGSESREGGHASDSEEESRRQAAKEEKRRRKIAALKAANAAHHSGTDDGRPAKKISFMQDSESEKEDKHRRMMSESSAHDSEGEGLTMGGRGGKVSFDSKAIVFSLGQDDDEKGDMPEKKKSSHRRKGSPRVGKRRLGSELRGDGLDPRMLEEQDENEDGIEIRDRFEMADHRMAKQEYTQTHKISKSASSHVLKVKNIKKGPRTRYDSHMSTDGGYTTDEREMFKGIYGKEILKKFDTTPHEIFVQMDELNHETKEWVEQCRWVKYEERREPGSERWGRPHVSSLDFHSLVALRQNIERGVIILDCEAGDFTSVAFKMATEIVALTDLPEENKTSLLRMLLYEHSFVESGLKIGAAAFAPGTAFNAPPARKESGLKKNFTQKSFANLLTLDSQGNKSGGKKLGRVATSIGFGKKDGMMEMEEGVNGGISGAEGATDFQALYAMAAQNAKVSTILGRLKEGTEGTVVLVGRWKPVVNPICGFLRLSKGVYMPDTMEVNIPIRFVFVFLVPIDSRQDPHGVGRAFGTLMANPSFHRQCYKIEGKRDLMSAMNDFLDESVVLPPGDWDSKNLISLSEIQGLRDAKKKQREEELAKEQAEKEGQNGPIVSSGDEKKKEDDLKKEEKGKEAGEASGSGGDDDDDGEYDPMKIKTMKIGSRRVPRPWAGIVGDFKKRAPWFLSDFTDGLNGQALAAMIFIYFAALSGAIAFGGLTNTKSEGLIGIPETLITSCVAGCLFALFAGNPMIITGVTGPILLYDESLFQMSKSMVGQPGSEKDAFLAWRVWVGVWIVIIALTVSCFQGAVLVRHFTKFTKDIFASLVALLFIFEAFNKLSKIFGKHPLGVTEFYCNETESLMDLMNKPEGTTPAVTNATTEVEAVPKVFENSPNTALLSAILMFGTFGIGYYLRIFRNSHYFGRTVRRALGDFGVPIAIVIMVLIDYWAGDGLTEKLQVPDGLALSTPEARLNQTWSDLGFGQNLAGGWIINPFGGGMPTYGPFLAVVPGLLLFMVLFIETEICELLMLEKTNKKGGGLHWDIVLLCIINLLCAIFGGPWICSATVRACAHAAALTVMSTNHAPGEAPHVVEVKDQRLSAFLVSLLLGVSVQLSSVLKQVPFATLFGVFLYMGVSSIGGIQFFDRVFLLITPVKHHPNVSYVRRVKTWKLHLYTVVQACGLGLLWAIKSSPIALFFPFFVVLMVPLRMSLKFIFTPDELENLDGKKAGAAVKDEPDFYEQGIGG